MLIAYNNPDDYPAFPTAARAASTECDACFAPDGHHWPGCRNAEETDPDDDVRLHETAQELWDLGVDTRQRYY